MRLERLVPLCITAVRHAQSWIASQLRYSPEIALSRIPDPDKDPNNQPLRVDYFAEDYCRGVLEKASKGQIVAVGEESLARRPDLHDLGHHTKIIALMDIIDGTDLLLRRFGNWCSALVLFHPPEKRILATFVADHEGNIFFADVKGAYFLPKPGRIRLGQAKSLHTTRGPKDRDEAYVRFFRNHESGPLSVALLEDASVCYVGQKPKQFLAGSSGFSGFVHTLAAQIERKAAPIPQFRIYNFGGIPMMPKVANGMLDAVVSVEPSKPHDIVAGAYIALQAGCFMGDSGGNAIAVETLGEWLVHPNKDAPTYILAANEKLYSQMQKLIKPNANREKSNVSTPIHG